MKYLNLCLLGLFLAASSSAQPPTLVESFNYGGSSADNTFGSTATSDGGLIMCGGSSSVTDDVGGNYGGFDAWIVKIDGSGSIAWEQNYGGSQNDFAREIIETADGDYIFVGYSASSDVDLTENNGESDLWLVKISSEGAIIWQKSYGGSANDFGIFLTATSDGGVIAAGNTFSSDGDISENNGDRDMWITKYDTNGNLEWERTYGGSMAETALTIIETSAGHYAVSGSAGSMDGDVTGNNGETDAWILLLENDGDIIWEEAVGGSLLEFSSSIIESDDGGFVVAGQAQSSDGDVSENQGEYDLWVFKLNSSGGLEWESTYGGSENDFGVYIIDAIGEGFILVGNSSSSDGDLSENSGERDGWMIRVSDAGSLLWEAPLGGSGTDRCLVIMQRDDGSFRVVGTSNSSDGDVGGNFGNNDYWLMQFGQDPLNTMEIESQSFSVYPNPAVSEINIQLEDDGLKGNIVVTDLNGKLIDEIKVVSTPIKLDVSNYASGVYVLSLDRNGIRNSSLFFVEPD